MSDPAGGSASVAQRFLGPRAAFGEAGAPRLLEVVRTIPDVVALGRGDPDLPTPPHIVAAAEQALRAGHTHYTPLRGLAPLLQAVARKLEQENGLHCDPEREIMVTTGTQEAVAVAAFTLLGPGDEWLMPDPYYFSYELAVGYAGGRVVSVPTFLRNDFQPDPDEIERRITARTKAIILLTPHNPTGAVYRREILERIAEIAIRRNILVISDEIYEKIVYDGRQHVSIGTFPGMADRTITINGFSKAYRMTGWRIGYMAGPADFISAALQIKHTLSICAPSISQHAAVAALAGPQDCIAEAQAIYEERRLAFTQGLDELGIPYFRPPGTFYIFVDTSWTGLPSDELCMQLLRSARVFAYPGRRFGAFGEGFIRVSLLAPTARLLEGLSRIGTFLKERKAE